MKYLRANEKNLLGKYILYNRELDLNIFLLESLFVNMKYLKANEKNLLGKYILYDRELDLNIFSLFIYCKR